MNNNSLIKKAHEGGLSLDEALFYNKLMKANDLKIKSKILSKVDEIGKLKNKIEKLQSQIYSLENPDRSYGKGFEIEVNIPNSLVKPDKYRVLEGGSQFFVNGEWCGISYPMNASGDGPDMDKPHYYVKKKLEDVV